MYRVSSPFGMLRIVARRYTSFGETPERVACFSLPAPLLSARYSLNSANVEGRGPVPPTRESPLLFGGRSHIEILPYEAHQRLAFEGLAHEGVRPCTRRLGPGRGGVQNRSGRSRGFARALRAASAGRTARSRSIPACGRQ